MELRTFIAIELDRTMQDELARLERRLQDEPASRFVRWVAPKNIHLTIKFLGNVDSDLIPRLTAALDDAVQSFAPFELMAEGLGAFPNVQRPNNIWVGLAGDTRTAALLARSIEEACARLGLPRDDKGFTPHLTLGRVKREASAGERASVGKLIQQHAPEPMSVCVDHVALISSDLRPSGPIYTRLAEYKLRGNAVS